MKDLMNVAMIQVRRTEPDAAAVEESLPLCERAADAGAQFLCLGEYMIRGETEKGPSLSRYSDLARRKRVWLITSMINDPSRRGGNFAYLFNPDGRVAGIFDKVHGGTGRSCPVFATPWGKVGIMICYDTRFPELARAYALQGARVIFAPTASSFPDDEIWAVCCRARAMENNVFVVGVNRVGRFVSAGTTHMNFGRRTVWDPIGAVQAQAGSHANEVRLATLDLAHVDRMLKSPGDGPLLRSALLDRNTKAYELHFTTSRSRPAKARTRTGRG